MFKFNLSKKHLLFLIPVILVLSIIIFLIFRRSYVDEQNNPSNQNTKPYSNINNGGSAANTVNNNSSISNDNGNIINLNPTLSEEQALRVLINLIGKPPANFSTTLTGTENKNGTSYYVIKVVDKNNAKNSNLFYVDQKNTNAYKLNPKDNSLVPVIKLDIPKQ